MRLMQSPARLWQTADNLTRGALILAGAAATLNIGTYLGVSPDGEDGWTYLLHVLVMILGFWVFLRTGVHLWRTVLGHPPARIPWNRFLALSTAVAVAYLVVLAAAEFSGWGEGGAIERHGRYFWRENGSIVRELTEIEYRRYRTEFQRVFSAGWLFFSLALATWNHNLLYRRREAAAAQD